MVCGDQDRGGVEEDDIAAGAALPVEDAVQDAGVGVCVATDEGFDGGAGHADVFRGEGGECNRAVADFGDVGGAADGYLIETGTAGCAAGTVVAVNDEGVANAEGGHCFGHKRDEMRGVDAHDLRACAGRVGERAEEVEDGADASAAVQRGISGLHVCEVQACRVEEGEPMFPEGFGRVFGVEVYRDAEGFEDISGAALGGDGTVAMLGDGGSGGCGYECGGGGDIEGAAGIAAGAAGVDQSQTLFIGEWDGSGGSSHGVDKAGNFGGGFTAGGESPEEGGDLDVGELAGEDAFHEFARLYAGENGAAFDDQFEVRLERHCLKGSRAVGGSAKLVLDSLAGPRVAGGTVRLWFAHSSEVPIYRQLVTQMVLAILSGDLRPGDKLPSTRELARRFALHPNTVSAGYRRLEEEGWTERRRGSGVYVRANVDAPSTPEQILDKHIAGFFRAVRELGLPAAAVRSRVAEWLKAPPPDHFVLIDPDPELRRILITEIRQMATLPVTGISPEECAEPERLAAAIALCRPSKTKGVRDVLPAGVELITLPIRSPNAWLNPWLPAPDAQLIGIVSHWPDFLTTARTMLIAAGFPAEVLVFRDARKAKCWRQEPEWR